MKKSKYYKFLMFMAILSGLCAVIAPLPSVCALFCVTSFMLWFAAVMAPADEKYDYKTNDELERWIDEQGGAK